MCVPKILPKYLKQRRSLGVEMTFMETINIYAYLTSTKRLLLSSVTEEQQDCKKRVCLAFRCYLYFLALKIDSSRNKTYFKSLISQPNNFRKLATVIVDDKMSHSVKRSPVRSKGSIVIMFLFFRDTVKGNYNKYQKLFFSLLWLVTFTSIFSRS